MDYVSPEKLMLLALANDCDRFGGLVEQPDLTNNLDCETSNQNVVPQGPIHNKKAQKCKTLGAELLL